MTTTTPDCAARPKVPLGALCQCGWNNLCRLFLMKVWMQTALGLGAMGWWLSRRDSAATFATVVITLVLSSWMMSRERIRRSLAGERSPSGLGGKVNNDWSNFERPLMCLDEINQKRKAQEQKDRTAFRMGLVFTLLAAVVAVLGFR